MSAETKDIYEVLQELLTEVAKHKDQQRAIEEYLVENHSMPHGLFIKLVANSENVENLDETQAAVYINAIYAVTQIANANPETLLNAKQQKSVEKYKFERQEQLSYPLQYERTLSGSEKDYVTKLSYQLIAKHFNDGIWTYNFLTQRNPVKKVRADGSIKLEPKVNKRSVKEIKNLILEGKFLPDTPITINVLYDGEDELFYDEDNWTLIIESASEIDILDGYHRILAVVEAVEENPNIEGYLYVSIRNYDLETARFYLGQHNSFNTFDKTHVRRLKSLELSDKIVEDVVSKSVLKGRLAPNTAVRLNFNEITNFAILSDTVQSVFNPKTPKDKIDISKALITYFDYLFYSFEEEFITNVKEVHKTSWINHHNTFVLYIVFAHALYEKYGKDIPVDEIPRMVKAIDFTKGTSEFDKIISPQGKVNSNEIKRNIRKFAEEKAKELLG
jgi:hypothetical protein